MSEIFLNIINMSISASWLVLTVLILRLVLKKAPKWVDVLLWGFVAFRLICPFSFESMLSLIPSAQTVSPQIMTDPAPQISSGIHALNNVVNPVLSQSFTPAVGDSVNPLQLWIPVAAGVWMAGILTMLGYTAVSYFLLRRKVETAVRLRSGIFQSEDVDSPFVLGIIKPKIYLPFQMESENLEYVIAHEEAHIRRKDHWWKPFGFLLLSIHWFNPLMWVGYLFLSRDIELACDEKVIKAMSNENRADYSQALVACSVNRRSIAACPLAFGEVGVKARVKSVMNYKKPGFWIMVAVVIICTTVAVCFLTNPIADLDDADDLPAEYQFQAKVLEVHDQGLLVEPELGSAERSSADRIEIPLKDGDAWPIPKAGDEVRVVYDGQLQETYPVRITNVYRVEIMNFDSGPVETVHGNMKTYYRNADGTWQVDGRIYKYRLEISGQVPNAACPGPTTFVYLSNVEYISFTQAWDALFSSNCADWFFVEEAVLVDWPTGNIAYAGQNSNELIEKPDNRLDMLISSVVENYGKSGKPDGLINTESHLILGHEVISGTPVAGQTDHQQVEAVFVCYLNMKFRVADGEPEEVSSRFDQAILTFTVAENGAYTLSSYLEPQYAADYNADLMNLFASAAENAAENAEEYKQQLRDQCLKTATDYLENLKTQASALPGGDIQTLPHSEYSAVIDSILYDLDGDGALESCTLTYGPTSGLFSFRFSVCSTDESDPDPDFYRDYVPVGAYDLSFELAGDGSLRIKGVDTNDREKVVYFRCSITDDGIVIYG